MAEQKTNLNSASAEELTRLPGIGPTLAERIIEYREGVRLFEEPGQITEVSGIGERVYSTIADRLLVGSEEEPALMLEETEEVSESEEEAPEEAEAEAEGEPEAKVVPPGESISEEGLDLVELTSEERPSEASVPPTEVAEEEPSEAAESPPEGEAPDEDRPPLEAPSEEPGLPLASSATPSGTGEPSLWRRLSWLWTAMLGGLLGLVSALVVFAGINGSLDVAYSRAILGVQGRIDGLMADVGALEGDVDGLRTRLDALEGLTGRMDRIESAVGDLEAETVDLSDRTETLEGEVASISEELQVISDDVSTLREQAEQTRSFFVRLQSMLNDIFGEADEQSPSSESEGK